MLLSSSLIRSVAYNAQPMACVLQEVGPKGVLIIAIFFAVVIGLIIAILIAIGYRLKKRLKKKE